MFENFKVFFSNKKNLYTVIAALVILGGMFLLNKCGLYEGMKAKAEAKAEAKSEAKAADVKAADVKAAESPPPKKSTSAIIMNQMQ
jgi:preprotein translocase subunit SecF